MLQDYKTPLEDSNPPILSSNKVETLFHRVPEILHYHTLFRIALSEAISNWDRDEAIGDVFVATFSKVILNENTKLVLDPCCFTPRLSFFPSNYLIYLNFISRLLCWKYIQSSLTILQLQWNAQDRSPRGSQLSQIF